MSSIVPLKRAMVVSYTLPIVNNALSLTIQTAICHQMSVMLKSTGVG